MFVIPTVLRFVFTQQRRKLPISHRFTVQLSRIPCSICCRPWSSQKLLTRSCIPCRRCSRIRFWWVPVEFYSRPPEMRPRRSKPMQKLKQFSSRGLQSNWKCSAFIFRSEKLGCPTQVKVRLLKTPVNDAIMAKLPWFTFCVSPSKYFTFDFGRKRRDRE